MAVSIEIDFDAFTALLNRVGNGAPGVMAAALYEGAKIVADQINAEAAALPTEKWRWVPRDGLPRLISPEEKAALTASTVAGISSFRRDGDSVDTSVYFGALSGYAMISHNNGAPRRVPLPMLARAVNAGTTFRTKQPFMRKACTNAKSAAQGKMVAELEKRLQIIIDRG